MTGEQEEWRPVVGYEGLYEVSSLGRIRSLDRVQQMPETHYRPAHIRRRAGQILKPHINIWGYPQVNIQKGGVRQTVRVHTLVCLAFHGPRSEELECAHKDGDRTNNRADNLRWATRADNRADQILHGTRAAGEKNGMSKLSFEDVRRIRADKISSHTALATQLGVSISTISVIRNGKAWKTPGFC